MTNSDNSLNTTLFLPIVLAVSLIALTAAIVWATQLRPAPAEIAAAPVSAAPVQAAAPTGNAAHGQELFAGTCSACHGPTGQGIAGLGKDLTTSDFVGGQSDGELATFIKTGRGPSDPLNTTGIDMPPKGGNPALSDTDLQDIVSYLRTLGQ